MNNKVPVSNSGIFKSISFVQNGKSINAKEILEHLYEWIGYFDSWYKENFRINEGMNLHLIYHRNFNFSVSGYMDISNSIYAFVERLMSLGINPNISLDINKTLCNIQNTISFINNVKGASLIFCIDNNKNYTSSENDTIFHILEKSFSSKNKIYLSGNYISWSKTGIFVSDLVNRRPFSIVSSQRKFMFEATATINNYMQKCISNMKIVIDNDGSIYPCIGLVGMEKYKLGNIFNTSINKTAWGNKLLLIINELSSFKFSNTKDIKVNQQDFFRSHLPIECYLHKKYEEQL